MSTMMATALGPTLGQHQNTIQFTEPSSPLLNIRPRPTVGASQAPKFKAPAHKHAHHLHSIPPREKSTRTLILDHMLWAHARTRLLQARAELGMTISTSAAFDNGESPQSVYSSMFESDKDSAAAAFNSQEDMSDGEDIVNIKFGVKAGERNIRSPTEDEHEAAQRLPLAHCLRLRADGIEKVLIAMLDQPPEIQLPYSDEDAPRTPPAIHGVGEHFFPNGVRLRLTLSTLVNDLFARDSPTPLSPRPSNTSASQQRSMESAKDGSSKEHGSSSSPLTFAPKGFQRDDEVLDNGLPACLVPLAFISGFSHSADRHAGSSLPSFSTFTRASASPTTDRLPPIMRDTASSSQQTIIRPRRATGRVLKLYSDGADPSTANSPPSLRCPRHLHHSCQICAPVTSTDLKQGSGVASNPPQNMPSSPVQSRGAISLGTGQPKYLGTLATGIAPWKSGAGIGAGLASPGPEGTVLRRRTVAYHMNSHPNAKDDGLCAQGGKLAELIPRFLRLSALIAVELGREAKYKEDEAVRSGVKRFGSPVDPESDEEHNPVEDSGRPSSSHSSRVSALKQSEPSPFLLSLSFRPTRQWYGILSGLLTRAVLEGYLSRGWQGPLGMECLLGVGIGLGPQMPGVKEPEEDEFMHLDPDECPSLLDASKILFPHLCRQMKAEDCPEAEYEAEMLERISEFLTVPLTTPDLSTHFEDLAYKFPTEPIERAAIRFCEAVAKWRGRPELENYKKATVVVAPPQGETPSIDSLVQGPTGVLHPAPRPTTSPIERYFIKGTPIQPPHKRRRSTASSSKPPSDSRQRRPHFESSDDWTGPYGL